LEKIKGNEGPTITEEIFKEWKEKKKEEKQKILADQDKEKITLLDKGKTERLTGKELYVLNKNQSQLAISDISNSNQTSNGESVFKIDLKDVL
ncbi:MAG: hypothetical protein MHPSP_003854, partial [Paramarteilia canceri]